MIGARQLAVVASIAGGIGGTGCIKELDPITGTQSLTVDLVSPASGGTQDQRLPDSQRTITINVTARGPDGEVDTSFDRDVQVYAQYLGTLTPPLGSLTPLASFHVTAGVATNQVVTLPPTFGATTIWVDDGQSADPTYATGTSPTLWYRDPFIADLQAPADETALDALSSSPLENKQVKVGRSRYGARGRFVVTSVFAQGYTVSDVECADEAGTPPCTSQAYDHAMVFSFSAPRDTDGRRVEEGQLIAGFGGGVSEFNGLTEIGFPQTFVEQQDINPARMPAPAVVDGTTWFNALSDPLGKINFERNEAAPIQINNGVVCPIDDDYATYKQWKIAPPGGSCGGFDVINVITAGTVTSIDPPALVGMTLPKVVGVLRPVNIGTFNVWIIFPRSAADVILP
ncbi:MAG: hypothetical protein AB7P03_01555 [Kofleriaceae bacterium]